MRQEFEEFWGVGSHREVEKRNKIHALRERSPRYQTHTRPHLT